MRKCPAGNEALGFGIVLYSQTCHYECFVPGINELIAIKPSMIHVQTLFYSKFTINNSDLDVWFKSLRTWVEVGLVGLTQTVELRSVNTTVHMNTTVE